MLPSAQNAVKMDSIFLKRISFLKTIFFDPADGVHLDFAWYNQVITFVNNLCSGLPLEESLVAIGLFPGKEKAKSKFYILNVQ